MSTQSNNLIPNIKDNVLCGFACFLAAFPKEDFSKKKTIFNNHYMLHVVLTVKMVMTNISTIGSLRRLQNMYK